MLLFFNWYDQYTIEKREEAIVEILERAGPVRPKKVADEILNILLEGILTGELKPGDRLPSERLLAEKFSVHRNSVREALKKLEMLGLVEIRQGDGTFVGSVTEQGNILLLEYIMQNPELVTMKILKDLLRLRYVIETDAAYLAARNRSEKDVEILEELLYQEAKHISDPIFFVPLDYQFHSQIISATKNTIFQLLINSIKRTYMTFTSIFFTDPSVIPMVYEKHVVLVEAIKNRQPEEAREIMSAMLKHGEEILVTRLQKEGGNDGR